MEGKEVIIGTYENLILGYRTESNIDGSLTLETNFTDDSHRGALRCMSISPTGILASSSTDDSIRLHSLHRRKEVGGLFEHSGTVNCIIFFQGGHMFSASEDGRICMWKCKNWELLRTLKGHKSHVMSFAIHPSGKLGLSVGSDRSLLTWDLVTGKLAFQRKTKEVAQQVLFTGDGDHYVLVHPKQIDVCSLQDTKTVQEIHVDWRINATCFVEDNVLAVGGDDRHVLLIDILTGQQLMTLDLANPSSGSFNSRAKCISVMDCKEQKLVVVVTSNGNVKVFRFSLKEKKAEVLLFYETRVRVTCMTVYNPANEQMKRGRVHESDMAKMKETEKSNKALREKFHIKTTRPEVPAEDYVKMGSAGDDDDDDSDDQDKYTSGEKEKQERSSKMHNRAKKRKSVDQTSKPSSKKKGKVSGIFDHQPDIHGKSAGSKKKQSTKELKNQTGTNKKRQMKTADHTQGLKKKKKAR